MKLEMMRENPGVCFEVDVMKDMANWQSVIAWGEFEEITGEKEREQTMQILMTRLMPLITSETAQPTHKLNNNVQGSGDRRVILYRIKLNKKTGRYEIQ